MLFCISLWPPVAPFFSYSFVLPFVCLLSLLSLLFLLLPLCSPVLLALLLALCTTYLCLLLFFLFPLCFCCFFLRCPPTFGTFFSCVGALLCCVFFLLLPPSALFFTGCLLCLCFLCAHLSVLLFLCFCFSCWFLSSLVLLLCLCPSLHWHIIYCVSSSSCPCPGLLLFLFMGFIFDRLSSSLLRFPLSVLSLCPTALLCCVVPPLFVHLSPLPASCFLYFACHAVAFSSPSFSCCFPSL